MKKEQVTEELVRQNGNQAAAVMADYASQGGGNELDLTAQIILSANGNVLAVTYQRNIKDVSFGEVETIDDGCGNTQYSVDVVLRLDARVTKVMRRDRGFITNDTVMPSGALSEEGDFSYTYKFIWQ